MTQAELSYLLPLFDLASSLVDEDDVEHMEMGLGEIAPDSLMAGDDRDLTGYWVSMVVTNGVTACLDHVVTLRDIVTRERGTITLNAPWTLLRAAVESAAMAVWVMESGQRATRRSRALRLWHYDFGQRQLWENDTGRVPPPKGKSGKDRAKEVLTLATNLGIKPTQVSTEINYADIVGHGAVAVGLDRTEARARWREASAFAHGRSWPLLALTSPTAAQEIQGGFGLSLTLNEDLLRPLADLAHDLLNGALTRYAELAASPDV